MHTFRVYSNPTDDRMAAHVAVIAALEPLMRGRTFQLVDARPFPFHVTPHVAYLGGDGVKWLRSDFAGRLELAATLAVIGAKV